jgi:hypothetical protein
MEGLGEQLCVGSCARSRVGRRIRSLGLSEGLIWHMMSFTASMQGQRLLLSFSFLSLFLLFIYFTKIPTESKDKIPCQRYIKCLHYSIFRNRTKFTQPD